MHQHEAANSRGPARGVATDHHADDTWSDNGTAAEHLHPGQSVQATVRGVVCWSGTVETISAPLEVVWIREDALGERKLLDLREYQVRPQNGTDR